jgi:hypothetical protein
VLDDDHLRLQLGYQLLQLCKESVQPLREVGLWWRGDDSARHGVELGSVVAPHSAVTTGGESWIDPQDEHVFETIAGCPPAGGSVLSWINSGPVCQHEPPGLVAGGVDDQAG